MDALALTVVQLASAAKLFGVGAAAGLAYHGIRRAAPVQVGLGYLMRAGTVSRSPG